jgi:hypothetical protein
LGLSETVKRGDQGQLEMGEYVGDDTTDTAVAMEEAMLVCPDLIEVVSEALVTPEAAVAIIDGFLEDDEGEPEFNIDICLGD